MDRQAHIGGLVHRIQQHKQFVKESESLKGERPTQAMRRSREQLEEDLLIEARFYERGDLIGRHQMSFTFIRETYAPSIEPVSSLTPIMLRDLRIETHHRGRVLIVKTFCEPAGMSPIKNAIEDIQGSVDCLTIYNFPSTTSGQRILPKGCVVAVKEPYCKFTGSGGVTVQVDHPSDFILLNPHDSVVPPEWRTSPKATMTGSQLKEEANVAFKQGDWQKAGELYTEALMKPDNDADLRSTLFRNRAQVHLNLRKYEFALEDAIAAVVGGDTPSVANLKSYVRAGRAQYELGNFVSAEEYLDQARGIEPTNESVTADLARTRRRIQEQQSGEFDFEAMAQSATASHKRLDHASFTSNTRVAFAGIRGRGLFATKDIKHGNVVMVEKAFCVVFGGDIGDDCSFIVDINTDQIDHGTRAECLYEVIDKLRRNPGQASEFVDLYGGVKFKEKQVRHVDGTIVLDAFQVQAILVLNRFTCPDVPCSFGEEVSAKQSAGIWLRASYMNHSCIPNTEHTFIGDIMIVRATRDIKGGEEILASYQSPRAPFPERKDRLNDWGFQCNCPLCQVERQLPAAIFTERKQLEQQASDFIADNSPDDSNSNQPVSTTKVSEAESILRRLESTYDSSLYGTLPRLGCVAIEIWLIGAAVSAVRAGSSPRLDIAATTRLVQDHGYRVKVKVSGISIDRTFGFVCPEMALAAMYNREAWRLVGRPDVAMAFLDLAREVHLVRFGSMDEFVET